MEGPETTVTVTFVSTGMGTLMVFHQAGFGSDSSRDGHEMGWNGSFDPLENYLVGVPEGSVAN